jgi:cobalamin biosynthesis Mg chelatase CobN
MNATSGRVGRTRKRIAALRSSSTRTKRKRAKEEEKKEEDPGKAKTRSSNSEEEDHYDRAEKKRTPEKKGKRVASVCNVCVLFVFVVCVCVFFGAEVVTGRPKGL